MAVPIEGDQSRASPEAEPAAYIALPQPIPPSAAALREESVPERTSKLVATEIPKTLRDSLPPNVMPHGVLSGAKDLTARERKLETARYLRTTRQASAAEPLLVELLDEASPENIRQSALLELSAAAQDQLDFTRAQQVYAQFLSKWPDDLRAPEILLRQGLLFRQMGLDNLALTKFYSVMTSALVLKNDRLDYYARLVQQAQMEIAETHYALGKYTEAAEFFTRLRKQTNTTCKALILYKLTRCHSALGRHAETVADAQDFLALFPRAVEQPEIRYYLAVSLKQLGRDNESLQQVLLLLREQRELTQNRPAIWAYWQQRAGNLIGNHLYREGDYPKALEVYLDLAQLDSSLSWRLPVNYQIGMTYERLWQPQKAAETYTEILSHEKELAKDASPSLQSIFEMARWRIRFIAWQTQTENATRQFHTSPQANPADSASLATVPDRMP